MEVKNIDFFAFLPKSKACYCVTVYYNFQYIGSKGRYFICFNKEQGTKDSIGFSTPIA